jgi:peptidoglycan/xylan/chitin deacetylase (PgdA/CDA1 family)
MLISVNSITAIQTQAKKEVITRRVAFTFDDLPQQGKQSSIKELKEMTRKLLDSIKRNNIPAVGFVNESKLYQNDELAERRAILQMWIDKGVELGNHTFSHPYFYKMTLKDFQENVLQGEKITSQLFKDKGRKTKYFRHPFLNTGPNLETKQAFEKFLTEQGYTIAPVTIDNSEWLFAQIYANAENEQDIRVKNKVALEYIPYMEKMFEFYEKLSVDVIGYEVPQILLLHANLLNAEQLDKLAAMLESRGYKFISLEEALKDKAYSLPDTYVGPIGISWLHRWTISKGMTMRKEPSLPEFIAQFDKSDNTGSSFKTEKKK